MSVSIKNMTMPTCCDECWALDDYGDYPVCRITQEQRGYNFNVRERRMDKCPLEAEPIVRCRDCKHFRFYDGTFGKGWMCFDTNSKRNADDFCSRGERHDP